MNEGINTVKTHLLPQLVWVDQIVISHQITDPDRKPEQDTFGEHIVYTSLYEKGLSKNRNNALQHCTTDICYICDDDLVILPHFASTIKDAYTHINADIITFQAQNEQGKHHFPLKKGHHTIFSVGRISSRGITRKRAVLNQKNITFDEQFWLGAQFPVGEENIFLKDSHDAWLRLYHQNTPLVEHPDESSGTNYRKELIIARIQVFKRMYGLLWGIAAVGYFTVLHFPLYRDKFSVWTVLKLSMKSLFLSSRR